MKLNSRYWYKRATEMRNVADQTKDPQSKGTMLGIAHDYHLLACQFEYHEKWALRDVTRIEASLHLRPAKEKGPEGPKP
jgi:hypothetical protein